MSLPLPVILQELETSPNSIIKVLYTLHHDKQILNNISKSDLKHLVSRTLNLSRSANVYNKWCGINLITVLSKQYSIVSSDGSRFVSQIISILENHNGRTDTKILVSSIECLNTLCDQTRGKPTLTREILTPNLPKIIGIYMDKIEYQPHLVIKSLNTLIKFHPTTFRPFGNKLKSRLLELSNTNHYLNFPDSLKNIIGKTIATLPAIEKVEPESKWSNDVTDLIKEISQVLLIYKNFLNIDDDEDLLYLFKSLPQEKEEDVSLFPPLRVDVNDHSSVLLISNRVEVLMDLLKGYITSETQFSVRVPIGDIIILIEIICSINTRFIHFKRDIRDEALQSLIESSILINQKKAVQLMSELPKTFRGNMLPHLSNVLSILETLIPFKNRKISFPDVLSNETFIRDLLKCVENNLSLVNEFSDNSQLLRFVEVGLFLIQPRLTDSDNEQIGKQNLQQQLQNGKKSKKNNKKKANNAVPLADILSHQHLFIDSVPEPTLRVVRSFINTVITRAHLPPTQYYKIMRYLIIEAVKSKKHNSDLSNQLKSLLINSVLYPETDKVSLLPIVSSIMGDDPLISVFNNPRLPPLPIHIMKANTTYYIDEEAEDAEEDDDEEQSIQSKRELDELAEDETNSKRQKPSTDGFTDGSNSVSGVSISQVDIPDVEIKEDVNNEKLFKNASIKPEQLIHFPEAETVHGDSNSVNTEKVTAPADVIQTKVTETESITQVNEANASEDSDFEMPELNADDSEDDDE